MTASCGASGAREDAGSTGGAGEDALDAAMLLVHVFLRQPGGEVALSPLQSVGAPDGNPVHVYSDDTHFEPLWPAWEPDEGR
jgi:hypothetical protein